MFRSTALVASAVMAVTAAATPALSQEVNGSVQTYGLESMSAPARFGLDATTPSRIESSRREMNRGRRGGDRGYRMDMTPRETREYAERVIRRGGFVCTILDAAVVARSSNFAPLVEVDCDQGGGLILADTTPIQWTDCLDVPQAGIQISHNNAIAACRLPGNVASVAGTSQTESERN